MIFLDSLAGNHIDSVCSEAAEMAAAKNEPVRFTFNDTEVICQPGESAKDLRERWDRDSEAARKAYLESPEYKEREAARAREEHELNTRHLSESASTEAEMRAAKVPRPHTIEQLNEYINSLVDRQHDYGTCVYAMSMAATAALYYVSHKLGVTGFQASCADLDILRRSRNLEGPFILLKGEDALYPQYDLGGKLQEALREWQPWLSERAKAMLAEEGHDAHPEVRAHWERLAKEVA